MPQDPGRRQSVPQVCRFLFLIVLAVPGIAAADDKPDVHWAFRKPTRPEPPALDSLKHAERVRNPIDRFVFRQLEASNLDPAPQADQAVLVRRAYFDLLGLPPTP